MWPYFSQKVLDVAVTEESGSDFESAVSEVPQRAVEPLVASPAEELAVTSAIDVVPRAEGGQCALPPQEPVEVQGGSDEDGTVATVKDAAEHKPNLWIQGSVACHFCGMRYSPDHIADCEVCGKMFCHGVPDACGYRVPRSQRNWACMGLPEPEDQAEVALPVAGRCHGDLVGVDAIGDDVLTKPIGRREVSDERFFERAATYGDPTKVLDVAATEESGSDFESAVSEVLQRADEPPLASPAEELAGPSDIDYSNKQTETLPDQVLEVSLSSTRPAGVPFADPAQGSKPIRFEQHLPVPDARVSPTCPVTVCAPSVSCTGFSSCSIRLDQCWFGCECRKPTRIASNSSLLPTEDIKFRGTRAAETDTVIDSKKVVHVVAPKRMEEDALARDKMEHRRDQQVNQPRRGRGRGRRSRGRGDQRGGEGAGAGNDRGCGRGARRG